MSTQFTNIENAFLTSNVIYGAIYQNGVHMGTKTGGRIEKDVKQKSISLTSNFKNNNPISLKSVCFYKRTKNN